VVTGAAVVGLPVVWQSIVVNLVEEAGWVVTGAAVVVGACVGAAVVSGAAVVGAAVVGSGVGSGVGAAVVGSGAGPSAHLQRPSTSHGHQDCPLAHAAQASF
jgi:hypothetical protein